MQPKAQIAKISRVLTVAVSCESRRRGPAHRAPRSGRSVSPCGSPIIESSTSAATRGSMACIAVSVGAAQRAEEEGVAPLGMEGDTLGPGGLGLKLHIISKPWGAMGGKGDGLPWSTWRERKTWRIKDEAAASLAMGKASMPGPPAEEKREDGRE